MKYVELYLYMDESCKISTVLSASNKISILCMLSIGTSIRFSPLPAIGAQ